MEDCALWEGAVGRDERDRKAGRELLQLILLLFVLLSLLEL